MPANSIERILIFLPNWVGDVVMATPAIAALRERFGDAKIVGIGRPYLQGLLDGGDLLDEQWEFDPRSKHESVNAAGVIARMRDERFDLAVLLTNSLRPAWMAYRAGIPERIGYAANGRSPLLTAKAYFPRRGRRRVPFPCTDMYLRVAELAGCLCASRELKLFTTDEHRAAAEQAYQAMGLREGRVVLMNGGGAFGPAKQWPDERVVEVARRIVDDLDHDVLVLCGPKERDGAKALVAKADRPNIQSMADQKLEWPLVKACIERGRLLVTTDSGPRHIATAFGLPVVTLFGPTDPAWIDNPTVDDTRLSVDTLDCLGCRKRECPLPGHPCMQGISSDRVIEAVMKITQK